MNARLFGEFFVTLLVIMDPPGSIPVFLSLTGGQSRRGRRRSADLAVATAFVVIVAFALFNLQDRSTLFVKPGDEVYEGMVVGENARPGDMDVNPTREKKLTNMRSKGSDENIQLEPPRELTLEAALEYIEDDELIEVTPQTIRLRKRFLSTSDRKRLSREAKRERASG